ncbi:MAG: tyrosine-type recombinase/integrase [Treponema sp.]|nr:tyrosine-type recombinase/integrase [Treponema sp.]
MNTITKKQDLTRCIGTYEEKLAHSITHEWLLNGPPDSKRVPKDKARFIYMVFCDFIFNFWDFDTSEYFKEKITEGKQLNKSHPLKMQASVDLYYLPYFKQTLLCEITEEKLTEFLVFFRTEKCREKKSYSKNTKGLSASTVKLARNAAIIPLRYAKRKKIIKSFDFDAIIRPNGDYVERGILSREQTEALFKLKWRDPRAYLICKIASQTAARIGEIRALRVCNILEDRIYIQHSWSDNDGGLKSTKNRENRIIPILPELHQEIFYYMKQTNVNGNINNLLFPGKIVGKPYCHKQINKEFYFMLEKIGITEIDRRNYNIVFHSWRHYGAKNLAEVTNRNIGIAVLGHKTARLFDHYANHIDDETFKGMEKTIREGLCRKTADKNKPIPNSMAS